MSEVKTNAKNEMWAVLELMGHGQTAGVIRPGELGGLIRVDVPVDEGFRTEYYGEAAIYSVKMVSEEIARAFAQPRREINAYDTPIVPRSDYERAMESQRTKIRHLEHTIDALQKRLTTVNSLPEPEFNDSIDADADTEEDF